MRSLVLCSFCLFFAQKTLAEIFTRTISKRLSPEQNKDLAEQNRKLNTTDFLNKFDWNALVPRRPWAEYETARTLIFAGEFSFSSREAKLKIARNLPKNIDLLIYSRSKKEIEKLTELYKNYIPAERLHFLFTDQHSTGNYFWSRDGVPIPTIEEETEKLRLVDARYYHKFEADNLFSELFAASLDRHPFYFEGGNFIANTQGDCLIINNMRVINIPDSIFEEYYGCSMLVRLPHVKGIGHVDESVKYIDHKNCTYR